MIESEWMDMFAEELIAALQDRNMTQRELADAAGLAESCISDYVHRRKMPGVRAVINISYALDMEVGELIDFAQMIY